MPRKSDGQKIDELEKSVAGLLERVDAIRTETGFLGDKSEEVTAAIAEIKTGMAVLRRDLEEVRRQNDEMKREREEASKRHWSLLPPVVGAIVSAIVSAVVATIVSKR